MGTLILFDIDGTLAPSTLKVSDKMVQILRRLKVAGYILGLVGGGTYEKICLQVGSENTDLFTYIFSENGIISYSKGHLIHENGLKNTFTETEIMDIEMKTSRYLSGLILPIKGDNPIIRRNGMWSVTPIGSDCTMEERQQFAKYDKKVKVRERVIDDLNKTLKGYNLDIKIGGQIGIGIHPVGWDKSYILNLFDLDQYKTILFFGDKCTPNGNDYSLYIHPRIKGYNVIDPNDTIEKLHKLLT